MQILYVLAALAGMTLIFFGSKWLLKFFVAKNIVEFSLTESFKEFKIEKKGLYSINFIGGWYARNQGNFEVRIIKMDESENIPVIRNTLKPQITRKMRRGIEFYKFKIANEGMYRIELFNQADLQIKRSKLFLSQLIFKSEKIENIKVLVKETIANWKLITGIAFLVFGINIVSWSLIFLLDPNAFG